ncbi:MAG: BatA domain-containing protein [Planctomycetota bacterium]
MSQLNLLELPLGVGFASTWMLGWLAAAIIPLAIHLLLKRQKVRIPWAAIELLRKVIHQESRRVRFEQWLLLFIRTSILVLFGLAVARPYWGSPESKSGRPKEPAKLWVLVIDTSYTMGYESQDGTRLQRAVERASELVRDASEEDSFLLLTLSNPTKALISKPVQSKERVLAELRGIELPEIISNIPEGLGYVDSLLQRVKQSQPRKRQARVVILSDFVQSNWKETLGKNKGSITAFTARHSTVLISFGVPNPKNIVVESLTCDRNSCIAGEQINVSASIFLVGNSQLSAVSVQISLDDEQVALEPIDLTPGQSAQVQFTVPIDKVGTHVIRASIPRDPLASVDQLSADSSRSMVVECRERQRILFVESEVNDSRMLQLSLTSGKPPSQRDSYRVIQTIELLSSDLDQWELIVANDLRFIDAPLLNRLRSYVQEGGNLILGLGPSTPASVWNDGIQTQNFLGFQLDVPSEEQAWAIDPLDYESPLTQPFRGYPDAGLLTTPVFKHWLIQQPDNRLIQDVGLVDSGPLITRFQYGRGWTACLLSAPQATNDLSQEQPTWNAIATWPSFVPLMQTIEQSFFESNMQRYNADCGSILEGAIRSNTPTDVEAILPNGQSVQLRTEQQSDGSFGWYLYQTQNAGVYRVQQGGASHAYSVNLIPVTEGSASWTDLADAVVPSDNAKEAQESQASATTTQLPPKEITSLTVQTLLATVFVLLLAESLLAWGFGRRVG